MDFDFSAWFGSGFTGYARHHFNLIFASIIYARLLLKFSFIMRGIVGADGDAGVFG